MHDMSTFSVNVDEHPNSSVIFQYEKEDVKVIVNSMFFP